METVRRVLLTLSPTPTLRGSGPSVQGADRTRTRTLALTLALTLPPTLPLTLAAPTLTLLIQADRDASKAALPQPAWMEGLEASNKLAAPRKKVRVDSLELPTPAISHDP